MHFTNLEDCLVNLTLIIGPLFSLYMRGGSKQGEGGDDQWKSIRKRTVNIMK